MYIHLYTFIVCFTNENLQEKWNLTPLLLSGGCLVAQSCPTLCDPVNWACQTPLSMGFSRQEYWSELPFPTPGDLPDPGIEPACPVSPALHASSLPAEPSGKHYCFMPMQMLQFKVLLEDWMPVQVSPQYWICDQIKYAISTCTPVVDSCWCMAKPIQYCKVISL